MLRLKVPPSGLESWKDALRVAENATNISPRIRGEQLARTRIPFRLCHSNIDFESFLVLGEDRQQAQIDVRPSYAPVILS